MFAKLQTLWKQAARRSREQPRLEVTDDEVALFDHRGEIWRFRWANITRVETFKRDLFVVDMICLNFSDDDRRLTYRTHDDMSGFDTLCERLRQHFPSIAVDWWSQVAFPAFETNHCVLYVRGTAD
jgi:hypothetical protein